MATASAGSLEFQLKTGRAMDFTIVILSEHRSKYPNITWSDWKDRNRSQMRSQGDHWSKATLPGHDINDCLTKNKIDSNHLVQWKEAKDTLYQVSLPTPT